MINASKAKYKGVLLLDSLKSVTNPENPERYKRMMKRLF
jgi:hypothetical protein